MNKLTTIKQKWIVAYWTVALLTVSSATFSKEKANPKNELDKPTPDEAQIDAPNTDNPSDAAADANSKSQATDTRLKGLVSSLVLKVASPTKTRVTLEQYVKKIGGFSTNVDDGTVAFKIPPEELIKMLAFTSKQGLVVKKTLTRQDLTLEINQLRGQLKSKRKILLKLREFFKSADTNVTLDIEQKMTTLVAEIETVKGKLRVLNDKARWARVEISFQFKQRNNIIYVHSPFDWLNTVRLDRFLEDF